MKKIRTLVLLTGLGVPVLFFGQGETSNWYFGNRAGIKFNDDGSVTTLKGGRLHTVEGCASISDPFGDLLFYTVGIFVHDRNHNTMQNGTGLHADPSCTQWAIIVPKPEDSNVYYIFTMDISENNSILIHMAGDGDYEYSINGFDYRDSNFFDSIGPGVFTISVRDKNGYGIVDEEISVTGYPKFFTPNGDGINDNWQLIGFNENFQSNSSVPIFDRYGKSLINLNSTNLSWNGTMNATSLPTADYWFSATLEDEGHFTLKRWLARYKKLQ